MKLSSARRGRTAHHTSTKESKTPHIPNRIPKYTCHRVVVMRGVAAGVTVTYMTVTGGVMMTSKGDERPAVIITLIPRALVDAAAASPRVSMPFTLLPHP